MKRLPFVVGATMATALLVFGCVGPDYGNGYYYSGANYSPYCDYYTPPWGYPSDYCRYRVWNEPVFYGGIWFNGPIYYRTVGGANWFWLNGDWRPDQWRGPRPRIDYSRDGNQFWRGDIHRGRDRMPPRGRPGMGGGSPPDAGRGGRDAGRGQGGRGGREGD